MKKLIFLLIFCLLGINLINTFSLFESDVTSPVEAKVAGFNIKVNKTPRLYTHCVDNVCIIVYNVHRIKRRCFYGINKFKYPN